MDVDRDVDNEAGCFEDDSGAFETAGFFASVNGSPRSVEDKGFDVDGSVLSHEGAADSGDTLTIVRP
mgnify:FL=1